MKNILMSLLLLMGLSFPHTVNIAKFQVADEPKLELTAESHILMEYDSGEILYEHEADEQHYPASMTKMMGMLLVLEEIDKGKLDWDAMVKGSSVSSSMGGTQIYLAPNEEMTVNDLFKAVAVNSANDAIVALGEKICGSNSAFVSRMNERGKELGLTSTNFMNATGFDDPNHYTTARDMLKIARQLLSHGEDILKYSRMKEAYIREKSTNPFWLVNTNKLLGNYEGLDGLKTGFTTKAGYNLTATAYRDGVRLISVTMAAKTIKDRSRDTVSLMNYGFSKVRSISIFEKDRSIGSFSFRHALKKDTLLYPQDDIRPVFETDTKVEDLTYQILMNCDTAPLVKDTVVGELIIENKSGKKRRYPVIIHEDVVEMEYFDYFFEALKAVFA